MEKAAHSSITKWLKDLTGSSNQSYDIGPHILVDDLSEDRGKFRSKSESFKRDKSVTVPLRTPAHDFPAVKDDIYENVKSASKKNRRKFQSFKEVKSKNVASDGNIYENVQDKKKFKRHSFSGTKKDRHRKYELQENLVAFEDSIVQRSRSGKRRKERHKPTAESPARSTSQSDDCEIDNYANHASEFELYANESVTQRLYENCAVENEYEVIDALVPTVRTRKGKSLSGDQLPARREDKSHRDSSCKRYEKNPSGGSVKILSRHSVLYHSQNRGQRTSRRSRQAATTRRHSFNMVTESVASGVIHNR